VGIDQVSPTSDGNGHEIRRVCIVGGAGFIGSHCVERLLGDDAVEAVTVFDNFTSGRRWHLERFLADERLHVVEDDVQNLSALASAVAGHETVIHLASNPDIARAATEPAVDFDQGTLLTHHVVEAVRLAGGGRILYASGSGVYGDIGTVEAEEDFGPLVPSSTYGASKLAGEALIASYCAMFGLTGCAFRFGNVVGPHQTHGVGYDFVRRLLDDPSTLTILGDGMQSKSYVHVDDIIDAVLLAGTHGPLPYAAYNVATLDYPTVRQISRLAAEVVGLDPDDVRYEFTGGDRGWRGDVPIVRLDSSRIRKLGWENKRSSLAALRASRESMVIDARQGRFT
jgi:UDP-glucose 4-epimerase